MEDVVGGTSEVRCYDVIRRKHVSQGISAGTVMINKIYLTRKVHRLPYGS